VKPTLPTISLTIAAVSAGLLFLTPDRAAHALAAAAAASPSPKPSATATASSGVKADPCGTMKSKWAHSQCETYNSSAPGDEYFGRMKMSYLGIDNTYKDGAISAGAYTTDSRIITKLDFATEALRKWAAKYPNDPQLARSYFLGVIVMRKVYTQHEQETAWEFMQLLAKQYPNTYFGKSAKSAMSQGFTEHWFALARICPPPLPLGAGVLPEVTPDVSPTPSPAPGHPPVEIITAPCVQASPAPS
jgi:hypothetical protein